MVFQDYILISFPVRKWCHGGTEYASEPTIDSEINS